ncbi:aminoglycoside phosphotransferase family protein [Streptomyces sp. BBFR51]|uniref:aminoglycoside phosphotransferase family protein n=1 Tax=Streptomyces sp. BBFR51 TaxID=3372856 RepID=UPI0037DC7E36
METVDTIAGRSSRPEAQEPATLVGTVQPGVQVSRRAWSLAEVTALLRDLRAAAPAPGEHSALRLLSHRIDFVVDLTDRRLAAGDVNDPAGSKVLRQARAAALELAGNGPVGLVHGDLHPANVLSGPGARMVAIDPRPTWGDPDFDAVDWVLEGVAGPAVLEQRIEEPAALVPGMSPRRVLGWCRALAALIAVPRRCAGRDDAETRFLMALADSRRCSYAAVRRAARRAPARGPCGPYGTCRPRWPRWPCWSRGGRAGR